MYIPKVGYTVRIKRPSGVGGSYYGIIDMCWIELEAKPRVVRCVTGGSFKVKGSGFCIPLDSVHPILLEDNV